MTDDVPLDATQPLPAGNDRLVTVAAAAASLGVGEKAVRRRIDRGSLRAVRLQDGGVRVPRAEIERVQHMDSPRGTPGEQAAGELVLLRELYANAASRADQAAQEAQQLREQLIALAHAGPIRAVKLRRAARNTLHRDTPEPTTVP